MNERYLSLLARVLTGTVRDTNQNRWEGRDWPRDCESMIGMKRMLNIYELAKDVLDKGVRGDFLEAGVWRGGASIFMRACLEDTDRHMWVCDSFEGLPESVLEQDTIDFTQWSDYLAVSRDEVVENFRRFGLLDAQTSFVTGFFADSLHLIPAESFALLRLDGDMYSSTTDSLNALYPKLSEGGYVILDDYFNLEPCKAATDDYRATHGISQEITQIDWAGAYWQK